MFMNTNLQVSKSTPTQFERQHLYYKPLQYQHQLQRRPLGQRLSTENGIINGFESFFNGLPPPI